MTTEPEEQGDATPPVRQAVTQLLQELSGGNKQAFDRLVPLVYEQLRKLAARSLRAERPNHTLRATALVHEAYMHLVDVDLAWQDRRHFYAVATRVMRQILVDHARSQKRQKRGGGAAQIPLDEAVLVGPEISPDVLNLDESLQRLSHLDRRKAQIVELLFFGGLTYEEIAGVLDISPATVHRELKMAKAWLYRDMKQTDLSA